MKLWWHRNLIYSLLLLLLLSGCQASQSTVNSEPNNIPIVINELEEVELDKPIVLGFSQLGSESKWRLANTESIEAAASEMGIELILKNAEQSQEKQFEAIRSFIEQKVDIIAFAPVVETGWEPILLEVHAAGIPVILIDRAVDVEDSSLIVTFIGSDFYDEGVKAGKYLIDKMRDRDEPIYIAELAGTIGSTPSIERGEGFREMINDQSNLILAVSESADFTIEKGKQVMKQFLEADQLPDVLSAHNDDMALGAIQAMEEAGLVPGVDIVIISVDGTQRALEAMSEGKINLIVECNPLLGPMIIQAANEIMAGRTLPKRIIPPENVFTETMPLEEISKRKY
ncbi:MAG TPA: ABC transporter substrate-binding protein [Candidatus Paenibacillus intestinavium]|nr:ABC transporter substrate-binding protein [Candidatus Paenibacillus intestinavium]